MHNLKKKLVLVCIVLFILGLGAFYVYPKNKLLSSFLFNNYNKEEIRKIEIRSTYSREDKLIENKDEINKIINSLYQIKLVQYYGSINNRTKGSYYIYFYDKDSIPIEVAIKGTKYVNIINDVNKYNKNYKILDNSLDINEIDKLLSK